MSGISEGTPTWTPGMDIDKLSQYFNVVTDTLGDPTGEADAEGNATYTKDDLTRATADEICSLRLCTCWYDKRICYFL